MEEWDNMMSYGEEEGDRSGSVLNLLQDPLLDAKLIDTNSIKLEVLDENEADGDDSSVFQDEIIKVKNEGPSSSVIKKHKKQKGNNKLALDDDDAADRIKIKKEHKAVNRTNKKTTGSKKLKKHSKQKLKIKSRLEEEDEEKRLKECGKQDEEGCWWCSKCGTRCAQKIKFLYHLKRFHNIEIGNFEYKCPHCDMEFMNDMALRAHFKRLHAGVELKVETDDLVDGDVSHSGRKRRHDGTAKYNNSGEKNHEKLEEEQLLKECGKQDEEGSWWCSKCGTRCAQKFKFLYHLKRFHNIKIGNFEYTCPHCDMEFRSDMAVRAHVKRVHADEDSKFEHDPDRDLMIENGHQDDEGIWWCTKCGLRYAKEHLFVLHLKKLHQMGRPISTNHVCKYCNYQFTQKGALNRHIRNMHPDKRATSSEESSESSNLLVEEYNKLNEHGKKNKHGTWLCNNCSAMYGRKSAFIKHLKSSHNVDIVDVKFDCPSCDEYFITQRALNDHLQTKHLSTDETSDGGGESSNKEDYEKLLKYGKKNSEDAWECNECSCTFAKQVRFIYHLKRNHNITVKDFNFPCVQCNMSFLSLKALRAHINNCHPDVTESQEGSIADFLKDKDKISAEGTRCEDGGWECNRCGTKYARDSVFMYHLKRYHGVDLGSFQHKCPYCKLDFMAFTGLRYHILNKHPKQYDKFIAKAPPSAKSKAEGDDAESDEEETDDDDDNIALSELKKGDTAASSTAGGSKRPRKKKVDVDREKDAKGKQQTLEQEIMNREGKKDMEGSWWCSKCGMRYSKDGVFLYHLKRAHNVTIGSFEYKCSYCKIEFISKPALRTHINRTHPEANENLFRNSSDFLQASILENQARIIEANCQKDTNNHWACKMCGSKFIKDTMCLYHLKRDHNIFIQGFDYKCNLCDMDYSNPQALRIHVKRVHGVDEDKILDKCIFKNNKWECKECPKVFAKRSSFAYHYARYHETADARFKYQCKLCQAKYISPKGLKLHLVSIHGETENTGDNVQLIKHERKPQVGGVKLNISINRQKNEVPTSKKDVAIASEMIGANQDGIHQCQACGYLLSSRKNLMEHIQHVHPTEHEAIQTILSATELDEESYCKICGHIFFSVIEFERHVKADHKREECVDKLLECRHCVFYTMSQYVFKMHLKTIHGLCDKTVPQWPCKKCNVIFDERGRLLEHSVIGTCYIISNNINDFECSECRLRYYKKSDIFKHVEEQHVSMVVASVNLESNNVVVKNHSTSGDVIKSTSEYTKCPYCNITVTFAELYSHLSKNHSPTDKESSSSKHHECLICKKTYPELTLLKDHIQEEHRYRDDTSLILSEYANKKETKEETDKLEEYKCLQCGINTPDNASLLAHVAGEHGAKKYSNSNNPTCSLCSQQFTNNSSLRRHIKVIHVTKSKLSSSERKPAVCTVCSEVFRSHFSMIKHFRSVHVDDPIVSGNECFEVITRGTPKAGSKKSVLIYKCKLCTFTAKTKLSMDIHLINKHWSGVKPASCSYCDFKTATLRQLERHMYTTHPDSKQAKDTVCLCDECGKTFNNKITFYQHRESHNPPKYKCEFCNYSTHLKTSIDNHKRVHTQEKPYRCNFERCSYSCTSHTGLKVHKFSHFPEKYMQTCDTCGFRTVNKYVMNAHVKEHTKGNFNFACEHCSYTSNDKSQLSVHCKRHIAAKACQLCEFSTKYKQTMKKHLKKRHGIVVSKDENVKWF